MEAVECGAAALGAVLGYYGRFVPLEKLRIECGVSRDGSKASNVLKAARKLGMEAKGFKRELEELYDVKLPAILFWEMNHFVVLEGFSRGRAYLNDPAEGPRSVSLDELDRSFSGVVLTFEPGSGFRKGGRPPSLLAGLRRRLGGSELALTYAVLCGLFLVIPGLVVPTFSRVFVDEYLVGGRAALVRPLLLGMGIAAVLQMIITALQQHYLLRFETKLALVSSSRFFRHVLRLPMSFFAQRYAGEIGTRVAINDRVAHLLSGQMATTLLDSGLVFFYLALMLLYDVPLTSVVLGLAAANLAAVGLSARSRTDATRRLVQEEGKLRGSAMNGLVMIETLKATGSESEFFARLAGYQAKALKAEQRVALVGQYVSAVPRFVSTMTVMAILVVGGMRVMDGAMSVGMLVAYQILAGQFVAPLSRLVAFGSQMQELRADMGRLDDVLAHPEDREYAARVDAEGSRRALKLTGEVELRGVTFGYSPLEPPLVEDLSIRVGAGQRVALVGPSGSGKSTIARLVAGLYEPWAGEILLDGTPRDQLPRGLVNGSLATVDQDIFLFEGSIRDNVTLWDDTIPVRSITSACRDAEIDAVVQARDGAYQARVSEGGGNFSGGQRQRLEIARALAGDPTIVVLDEATSALDPTTEMQIDEHLRRRGCTCIIVAHRLSTIRDCDEIVVLEAGRIVQRGTHEAMKDADGPYARLIQG
jgi:NHLM bacteriocin system ABC transporter peptidase/ATP-binding protein